MNRIFSVCFLVLNLGSTAVADSSNILKSSRQVLMEDPLTVVFQNPATLTPAKMRQAIEASAAANAWSIVKESDGRIELTANVRNKHVVAIEISYTAGRYEIRYLRSDNLLYEEQRHRPVILRAIHRNYNVWIRKLADSINTSVALPARIVAARPTSGMVTNTNFAPLKNINNLPYIAGDSDAEHAYKVFLGSPMGRAFAIAPNGAYGWSVVGSGETWSKGGERGDPVENAMRHCNKRGKGQCRLYAVDDAVVWWDEK